MNGSEIIAYLSILYHGDWTKIMDALHQKKRIDPDEAMRTLSRCKSSFVTLLDDEYPSALREMARPPICLFYRGRLSLISDYAKCVSMVGSRDASPYGLSAASYLARSAAEGGYAVVSGLATGIDTAVAEGCIDFGKHVAVLGNGLDYYYPRDNRDLQRRLAGGCGLVISEYPDEAEPTQKTFPARNRIIAGLSKGTLLVEAKKHSGSMITAAFALEFNRELAAVPYRAEDESVCNQIIKEGGTMIETKEDLLFWLDSKNII